MLPTAVSLRIHAEIKLRAVHRRALPRQTVCCSQVDGVSRFLEISAPLGPSSDLMVEAQIDVDSFGIAACSEDVEVPLKGSLGWCVKLGIYGRE